jgi:MerR family transcriptional regulator/heat shock protein HspR
MERDEPLYVISIAAQILDIHPQTLRYYERAGLIQPSRTPGNIRLYSQEDIERLQLIQRLVEDLGVNLAGVEVILNMRAQMRQMEEQMQRLADEVQRLRQLLSEVAEAVT